MQCSIFACDVYVPNIIGRNTFVEYLWGFFLISGQNSGKLQYCLHVLYFLLTTRHSSCRPTSKTACVLTFKMDPASTRPREDDNDKKIQSAPIRSLCSGWTRSMGHLIPGCQEEYSCFNSHASWITTQASCLPDLDMALLEHHKLWRSIERRKLFLRFLKD